MIAEGGEDPVEVCRVRLAGSVGHVDTGRLPTCGDVAERRRGSPEPQESRSFPEGAAPASGIADEEPTRGKAPGTEPQSLRRIGHLGPRERRALQPSPDGRHPRPSVVAPADGCEERLATEVVVPASAWSDREQHGPGRAVVEVDEVGVSRPLDPQPGPVAMREQRPVGRGLERPVRVGAACHPRPQRGSTSPRGDRGAVPPARFHPSRARSRVARPRSAGRRRASTRPGRRTDGRGRRRGRCACRRRARRGRRARGRRRPRRARADRTTAHAGSAQLRRSCHDRPWS